MNDRFSWRQFSLAVSAVVVALAGSNVSQAQSTAQSGQTMGLEEIVVTARKTAERLIDVPLAITAFSRPEAQQGPVGATQVAIEPKRTGAGTTATP